MISLYLMGLKGYRVLNEILINFGSSFIDTVVTARDANVQKDYYDELVELCNKNDIKFYDRSIKATISSNFRLAIGWKWLIADTSGLIILHDSLLPKYRGFNPLVTALEEGDTEIGATAVWAGDNYDEGDIIKAISKKIVYPVKIQEAIEWMANCYVDICLYICNEIMNSRPLNSFSQQHSLASYSLWRDDLDYEIDWQKDAGFIRRFIDAHSFPYKNAYTTVNGIVIRILQAEEIQDIYIVNRCAGKLFKMEKGAVQVVCGKGILRITEMQTDNDGRAFFPGSLRTRFV